MHRIIKKKDIYIIFLCSLVIVPAVVFAQQGLQFLPGFSGAPPGSGGGSSPQTLSDIAGLFLKVLSFFVPVIIALAVVMFIWGIAMFIANAGNEQKRKEGKNFIIWGILALFIIFSVWGIVQILVNTLGIAPVIPFFPPP